MVAVVGEGVVDVVLMGCGCDWGRPLVGWSFCGLGLEAKARLTDAGKRGPTRDGLVCKTSRRRVFSDEMVEERERGVGGVISGSTKNRRADLR